MKRKYTILTFLFTLSVAAALTSCKDADECPPKKTGYQTTVILPNPTELTAADRLYLQELRAEYDENKDKR